MIELDPVDRITADAVGSPGERVFYIQASAGDKLVTLLVEKQQVQLLAASVLEILTRVGRETGAGPPEEAMGLHEPIEPEWRAGRLSIGYDEERDLILLEAEEATGEEDEDLDDEASEEEILEPIDLGTSDDPGRVRFWATRDQMLSLARHGAAVCAKGRPLCPLCNNPLGPGTHVCPALNGQREQDET